MKVAFLTTDNRWVFNDYKNPIPQFGPAPQALIEGFASVPEISLHIVSSTKGPVVAPEKLAPNIWFHSQRVGRLGWMRTAYQGCIRASRKTLQTIQPDVVHGQGTESDCALSAVFSGFPNLITIHGNMRRIAQVERARPFSFVWLAARLEAFTVPRSAGVICITNHARQEVASLAKQTWIIPNAVDGAFFEVDARPPAGEPPEIICVGRVCALKNQNLLINALDPLASKHTFKLNFVGKVNEHEPYGAEFLRLIQSRPWCSRSAGFVDREKVRAILKQAAMLVLPSLEENCPMVVLEAMAAGIPVVGARVGGVPDLIEPEVTGLFCEPLDPASIRAAVEKLLANRSWAANLAVLAKKRARERFHPTVVARQHVDIYRQLLANKPSRR